MGLYDDDEAADGFDVKLMPKPGVRGQEKGPMSDQDVQQVEQTRGVLGKSDADLANAQSGWREALQRNIGQPIENVLNNFNNAVDQPRRKDVNEFGIADRWKADIPKESALPSGPAPETGMKMQATQDLYELMMNERSKLVERGMDPNSPENLQRFQKLRESFLKNRGG